MHLLFLLLLLLLSHIAVVTSVDGCYSDTDKDNRPRENCTGVGIKDIPVGLDQEKKVLLFPKNLFSTLSWTSFKVFPEIHEIDVTANKIPEVTPSPAPVLPSLSVLRLGSNLLTVIPDGSFRACPGLTELYLEKNNISALSHNSFAGLSRLEILDLTANQLSVLPDILLRPLTAIETLYLENNKIKVMPDDWFRQKEEVPYLYLSANPWACSCSLSYLHKYLNEHELNVYVRDGPIIRVDVDSVVCDSPEEHKGKPVIGLDESDLCSPSAEPDPPEKLHRTTSSLRTTSAAEPIPVTAAPTVQMYTEYHQVVTWSWYQTFTRHLELQYTSGSKVKTEQSLVESHDLVRPSFFTTRTPIRPVETTERVPSTVTPTTPTTADIQTGTTPAMMAAITPAVRQATTTLIPSLEFMSSAGSPGSVGVFCLWLFAGCLLLCFASAACVLVTLLKLVIWYRTVYRPMCWTLVTRTGGREGVALLMQRRTEEKQDGGMMALYRSVLFISREEEEDEEGNHSPVITLTPTGGEEERGVCRKTLYRMVTKDQEIEGWRDVMEECRVSAGDGGRRRVRSDKDLIGGEGAKKRYSVILREEREEAEGEREELNWVVGGWEVKQGPGGDQEVPRSSWGEWLAHYLPSMPWGVTTPPENEAAQIQQH